jgi:HD superfamily phosphodiesterase
VWFNLGLNRYGIKQKETSFYVDPKTEEVKPEYLASKIKAHTIGPHVLRVSGFAVDFAVRLGANQFVAEAGGLLHDLGAAIYGAKDHHITGAREAVAVLLRCECPVAFIGPIVSAIYSHRGSQRIAFQIPEAKCVAAADAQDHFTNLQELWMVQTRDLDIREMEVYRTVSVKLRRDWEKIDPEIKVLLDGTYEKAKQELLKIASGNENNKKRGKRSRR